MGKFPSDRAKQYQLLLVARDTSAAGATWNLTVWLPHDILWNIAFKPIKYRLVPISWGKPINELTQLRCPMKLEALMKSLHSWLSIQTVEIPLYLLMKELPSFIWTSFQWADSWHQLRDQFLNSFSYLVLPGNTGAFWTAECIWMKHIIKKILGFRWVGAGSWLA